MMCSVLSSQDDSTHPPANRAPTVSPSHHVHRGNHKMPWQTTVAMHSSRHGNMGRRHQEEMALPKDTLGRRKPSLLCFSQLESILRVQWSSTGLEDLISSPKTHVKKASSVVPICRPNAEKAEMGELQRTPTRPSLLGELQKLGGPISRK